MSYEVGKLIEAADYNTFAFGSPDGIINPSVPNVNSLLSTGFGSIGYNASVPLLPYVPVGQTVTASNWSGLITYINTIASHQGTQIDDMVIPNVGDTITALKTISSNIQRIFTYSLNSNQNSYDFGNVRTYQNLSNSIKSWSKLIEIQTTISFASGDSARYFFNRGGSIRLNPYYNYSTNSLGTKEAYVNTMIQRLGVQTGYIYMTGAPASNRILFGTQPFNGITQTIANVSGIITDPRNASVNSVYGYYNNRNSGMVVQRQKYTPSQSDLANIPEYCDSYSTTTTLTNGPQGQKGDNGNTIKFINRLNQVVSNTTSPIITFTGFPMTVGVNLTLGLPPTNYFNFDNLAPTISINVITV